VPTDKIRTISSAVDKLDKLSWEEVRKEMVDEKGLPEEVADNIGQYVVQKGQKDLLSKLEADAKLTANESMKAGMADMELLFDYLEAFNCLDNVSFDLSLARGLDYYTGLIYEVVTEGSAPLAATTTDTAAPPKPSKKPSKRGADPDEDRSSDPSVGVGSVAAGGRYDNLVGMFSGKNQIPCVGISFGVDRIFSITKARMAADKNSELVRNNEVDVYVMAFGGKGFTGLVKERIAICAKLWEAGIKVSLCCVIIEALTNLKLQAEFLYKVKPKLPNQFKAAEVNGVPMAVVIGEDEVAQGKVKIKEMGLREGHPEKDGVLVDLIDIVPEIRQRLRRKANLDGLVQEAEGLRVIGGIKGEAEKVEGVSETEKPAEESPLSQEATGAAPAS
jgi:histidyl-tRNA synthetase